MQPSFFDYAMEYQGGKKSMKFLAEMRPLIPFDILEKKLIEKGIDILQNSLNRNPKTPIKINQSTDKIES